MSLIPPSFFNAELLLYVGDGGSLENLPAQIIENQTILFIKHYLVSVVVAPCEHTRGTARQNSSFLRHPPSSHGISRYFIYSSFRKKKHLYPPFSSLRASEPYARFSRDVRRRIKTFFKSLFFSSLIFNL